MACQSIVYFSSENNYGKKKVSKYDEMVYEQKRKLLLKEAEKMIGIPYCYGGTEGCVDCSALTQKVYAKIGIQLPRTAEQQSKLGFVVDFGEVKAGDLLFFGKGAKVDHVGIYAGNGEIIHATVSRGVVREHLEVMSRNLLYAKRLIE
ncbi:MAG: C40 family peptidase [Ignavibacteria bacterium]|nr:C40 family peptidase [Ignavibacteria bacterium]